MSINTNNNTRYLNEKSDFSGLLNEAAKSLTYDGSFILIPTETVYGFACLNNPLSIENIYKAKARSENKPLQVLVSNLDMVRKLGGIIDDDIHTVVDNFCPGGLTVLVGKRGTADKIGFRIPDHQFVLSLIRHLNQPLLATSANVSGQPAALNINDALKNIVIKPSLIIDQGQLDPQSKASTVIDMTTYPVTLVREGTISFADILAKLDK